MTFTFILRITIFDFVAARGIISHKHILFKSDDEFWCLQFIILTHFVFQYGQSRAMVISSQIPDAFLSSWASFSLIDTTQLIGSTVCLTYKTWSAEIMSNRRIKWWQIHKLFVVRMHVQWLITFCVWDWIYWIIYCKIFLSSYDVIMC